MYRLSGWDLSQESQGECPRNWKDGLSQEQVVKGREEN